MSSDSPQPDSNVPAESLSASVEPEKTLPATPGEADSSAGPDATGSKKRIMIGSQRAPASMVKAKPRPPAPSKNAPATPLERQEKKSAAPKVAVPNSREPFSAELEAEIAAAFGNLTLDDALTAQTVQTPAEIELDSRREAKVLSVRGGDVFVALDAMHQGVLSAMQFATPPEIGATLSVIVQGFDAEEGLYKLSVPGGAMSVGDWSSVSEGIVVEARITGHNKGGLECEVSQLRGFIPASQIALYRVENLAEFTGEKWNCLVTEVDPERRKLVLSRRAVLEREQAETREKMKAELAEGQIREGTVRSLQDFGAFVDLGGIDGLLHVSQLSWQRVKHPSEVLSVGQRVKVTIRKVDQQTGKISLSMRDLVTNPWDTAGVNYHVGDIVKGRVTRIADFGAFVELEPGIEGLVHISEMSHKRVMRVRDVLQEGAGVEAKITAVDPQARRIGLSTKATEVPPEIARRNAEPASEEEAVSETSAAAPELPKSNLPLKGGVERPRGGEKFGLKW